jgi:hypothetical protein
MVETKIWQMTLFQNLILFANHYGNLQEMLEMASFFKYVDLYLTSEWGRFHAGHSVYLRTSTRSWMIARVNCTAFKLYEYFRLIQGRNWVVTILLCIRKVPDSNLGPEIGYPGKSFLVVSLHIYR